MFPFICFDTEDNSQDLSKAIRAGQKGVSMFDKKVTQIAAITAEGKQYYCPGKIEEFLKWLNAEARAIMRDSGASTCYVYALNIQYDLGNLFADVLDILDCTLVGGRMIKAVCGGVTFVDVWNIYQCSAAKLGETFGLKKLDTKSMATDREYVIRDVEIIRAAMLYVWEFAGRMGVDSVPPTMGSLGVNLWKLWGGETVHHSHEMTREAIYGGRVELFKCQNDNEQVRYTDINSLYPTVMCREFPGEMEDTGTELKRLGIAQVTMDIPYREIMVLPWRSPEGKILYPWGKITGVWTIAEIRAAEQRGAKIIEVHNVLSTDEGIFPYRSYMERVYKIRKESKSKTEQNLFKLLMNTLYGRTGTTGVIGRTVTQTARNQDKGICFGLRVLVNYAMPLGEEVNWSHAAYITSYGRLELLKYLELVGVENLIYCDTDSVIFDAPDGKIPFATGKELGQMKIETKCSVCHQGWHPDKPCAGGWENIKLPGGVKLRALSSPLENWEACLTFAPKMYRLADQFKAKGVPKKLQQEFIEKGNASFDLPFKFREAVAFFDRDNAKKLSIWRQVDKENHANYDKKTLRGNRYFPCEINDV